MKVHQNYHQKVSFKRELSPEELKTYNLVLKSAQEKSGRNGKTILIVHDACLPQTAATNTGVGNLGSKDALLFFDFMKNYLNINAVEVLPPGELSKQPKRKFYCAYSTSAFALSPHQINLERLLEPEYGEILKPSDFKKVVKANTLPAKATIVNYENVVDANSPFDKALKTAFIRFQQASNLNNLKNEFETYKKQNDDWLKPKILFKALETEYGDSNWRNWNELDKNLLDTNTEEAQNRIASLKDKYKDDAEFYKFKQFLADKHLQENRTNLNKKGLKLIGDCLIGFSNDEQWAYKKAFNFDYSLGWSLPAYNYDEITNPQSPAGKLLKKKVQIFAKRYDSIRFDVSWSYVEPKITPKAHMNGKPYAKKVVFESELLNTIEDYVREIKGADFDVKDLIHEFDAAYEDFKACEGVKWRKALQNRTKALGTTYMDNHWGRNEVYLALNGGNPNFILGVGNHDPQPLRQIAYGIPDINGDVHKTHQIQPLVDLFKIKPPENINNPIEFIKYKFAEIMTAKHNQYFYMDVFGREDRFDSQAKNGYINYRQKIPENFQKAYIDAVESGHGLNPMDALEKVFKLKELDKSEPELYKQIVHFRDILLEKAVPAAAKKNSFGKNAIIIGTCTVLGAIWTFAGHSLKNQKQAQKLAFNQNLAKKSKPVFKDFIG